MDARATSESAIGQTTMVMMLIVGMGWFLMTINNTTASATAAAATICI